MPTSEIDRPAAPGSASRALDLRRAPRSRRETWRRRWRYLYLRFIRLQGTPHALARGLAAGVFAGLFPFFGLQTILALAIAVPLRGNKIVAAAATWISNPFTYVPIYWINFRIGQKLLGSNALAGVHLRDINSAAELAEYTSGAALELLVGCAFVGLIASAIAYVGGLRLFRNLSHLRHERRRLKRERLHQQ